MSGFETFVTSAVDVLTEQINSANSVADRVINAENQNKLIHEVRETNEDIPEIVEFREWVNKAQLAIEKRTAAIDQLIVERGLVDTAPVDVPAETENYKTVAAQVKAMLSTLKMLPGGEDAAKNLPELKSLPGVRKSSGTSGGGTGTRRPRLSAITVDYQDGNGPVDVFETKVDEQTKESHNVANLTVLSKVLSSKFKTKIEVKGLQDELFAAAKTDDLSSLDGKPVEFPVTIPGEGDTSTIVLVTATPTVK
jgi:hypothetical protein